MNIDTQLIRKEGCQWVGPEQDPQRAPLVFCGCKDLHGESVYCEEHYHRVYAKGTALRKRHKDIRKKQAIEDLRQLIYDIAEELEDECVAESMTIEKALV